MKASEILDYAYQLQEYAAWLQWAEIARLYGSAAVSICPTLYDTGEGVVIESLSVLDSDGHELDIDIAGIAWLDLLLEERQRYENIAKQMNSLIRDKDEKTEWATKQLEKCRTQLDILPEDWEWELIVEAAETFEDESYMWSELTEAAGITDFNLGEWVEQQIANLESEIDLSIDPGTIRLDKIPEFPKVPDWMPNC